MLSFSYLLVDGYYTYYWGRYPRAGILHPLFVVYLLAGATATLYRLHQGYQASLGSSPLISAQLKFTLVALFLGFTASIDFLQTYGVGFYPLGYLFAGLCVTVVAYTMAKYELMDVSLVPSRPKVILSMKLLALIPAYLVILLVIRIFTGTSITYWPGFCSRCLSWWPDFCPTFRKEWNGPLDKRCFENGMTRMTHWSNSLNPLYLSLS